MWHYVARFWRGPISESQAKSQVRTMLPRGRYTLARITQEIVAEIGISRVIHSSSTFVIQSHLSRPYLLLGLAIPHRRKGDRQQAVGSADPATRSLVCSAVEMALSGAFSRIFSGLRHRSYFSEKVYDKSTKKSVHSRPKQKIVAEGRIEGPVLRWLNLLKRGCDVTDSVSPNDAQNPPLPCHPLRQIVSLAPVAPPPGQMGDVLAAAHNQQVSNSAVPGTLQVWAEPFANLRLRMFNGT